MNANYIVYKIRGYDGIGIEHNYHFSCGMNDNHSGICFLKDEKTMRVYDVAAKPHYMDISNFPTNYYNPCRRDMWNVVCVVYDTTPGKSSLWINHGKIGYFACRLPLRASTLNLFNRVVYFDESSGFNGYIESVEIPTGLIAARITYLCEMFKIPKRADDAGRIESHYRCYILQYWTVWAVWSVYYIAIVVHCTRWIDETAGMWSYAFHSRKVMGLETANSFAWKGMYTASWYYCTHCIIDVGLQYMIYLLEKLVDGLASKRRKPARRSTITTTL